MLNKKLSLSCLALALGVLMGCGGGEGGTLARIKKDKKIYIGAVPFEPPLLYQRGQAWVGPEAELAGAMTAKLASDMSLSLEPFWISRSYKSLDAALVNQEVDFVVSVFSITEARKQVIAFSDPYYTSEMVLVINPAHKGDLRPNDLAGQKLGVREGTAVEAKVKEKFQSSTTVPFDTLDEAVLALKRGEVDAVIDDRILAGYSLATTPGVAHLEIVPGVVDTVGVGIAVRKGETELLKTINSVIQEVKSANKYTSWTEEHLGDRLQEVEGRHAARLERAKKAAQPRRVVLRVSRGGNSSFDIYRFANLSFVLTETESGQAFTTSKIDFQGKTGVASVSVPPGNYRVVLTKFNVSVGSVLVRVNDPDQVTINLQVQSDGTMVLTRG